MVSVVTFINESTVNALNHLFSDFSFGESDIVINETKPEFQGDYTVVLFPFVKKLRLKPAELGQKLGDYLLAQHPEFSKYEVIAGFLNLELSAQYWRQLLSAIQEQKYNFSYPESQSIMVEYSSPNTNKPLHFGHLRNIFLGWSVSELLKLNGHKVVKANLINDRGIHICKSMVAWQRFANGETPESTGIKGDHLVGDYYVKFNDAYKEEIEELVSQGMTAEEAEKEAPILKEAQEMLRLWEDGDEAIIDLWKKMNNWVYKGFDVTYKEMGIDFDKMYYESDTYLLGKEIVEEGLAKGAFYQREDGSVWIDLSAENLDEKLLLRSDGTSVYMTQDLGTAKLKYQDFHTDQSIYVIGDEQNHHMAVLKAILERLDEPFASGIYHLSYGMVELPTGRMKSREGTVVDADDMIAEMIRLAKEQTEESGKTEGFTEEELKQLYKMIGLGALKFYLLRVEPKKKMIFDPKESIDLHGFTATFIQYAHARICSILRRAEYEQKAIEITNESLEGLEKNLLIQIEQYDSMVALAGKTYNPSILCNYAFRLAQTFNSFFDKHSVLKAENEDKKAFRLALIAQTAKVLKNSMALLGIQMPKRM